MKIKILDSDGNSFSTTTDANGGFLIENLPAGEYQVNMVTPEGYQAEVETQPATVTSGSVAEVYFELTKQASPVADAGPDQTVNEGAPVTLIGSQSSDPEGSALVYYWSQCGRALAAQPQTENRHNHRGDRSRQ